MAMQIDIDASTGQPRPRKFTIQSHFGRARQPRSRKNRPCDVCRRRKTACVITSEPPCLFCKTRGLECQSASPTEETSQADASKSEHESPQEVRVSPNLSSSPDQERHRLSLSSPANTFVGEASEATCHQPSSVVHQGLVGRSEELDDGPDLDQECNASISSSTALSASCPPHTLEDNDNKTAHSMGLSAEQDTYFLDAFRCLIISENDAIDANIIQVHPGSSQPDDHPVHFLLLENENPEFTNQAKEAASDGTEILVWPYSENLVRLYFRHVHPTYPVVTKARFLRRFATARMQIPASLRGAVYAMACVFWDRDPMLREPCPFQQHQLVDHAHEALRREHENPNLFSLQACLLLHHITPPEIDSVETPSMWTLTAQTTACAQTIGLHQDPGTWHIQPWEKRVRRKLWWAVFSLDCWSSICHGNPPHISCTSYTTTPPDMDDMRADEDVPEDLRHLAEPDDLLFQPSVAARFLEHIKVARMLREILDCSFQVRPRAVPLDARTAELVSLRERFRDWHSLLPRCLTLTETGPHTIGNCNLYLAFYASQALLYRGLMTPATRTARANPDSNLRKWFVTALEEFQAFAAFFSQITEHDLRGFWSRHARSQLILCGNFLIYLFLLASEPPHIEKAYRLLGQFNQSLQTLSETSHKPGRLLLRPVRLRVDSFFLQAAQILRQGGNEDLV